MASMSNQSAQQRNWLVYLCPILELRPAVGQSDPAIYSVLRTCQYCCLLKPKYKTTLEGSGRYACLGKLTMLKARKHQL